MRAEKRFTSPVPASPGLVVDEKMQEQISLMTLRMKFALVALVFRVLNKMQYVETLA